MYMRKRILHEMSMEEKLQQHRERDDERVIKIYITIIKLNKRILLQILSELKSF